MHSLPTKWHSPSPKLSCLLLPTKSKNFLWPFEAGCSETCDNLGVARNSARNATFGRKESFVSSATVVMVVHRHLCSCCCNTQSHNRTIAHQMYPALHSLATATRKGSPSSKESLFAKKTLKPIVSPNIHSICSAVWLKGRYTLSEGWNYVRTCTTCTFCVNSLGLVCDSRGFSRRKMIGVKPNILLGSPAALCADSQAVQ